MTNVTAFAGQKEIDRPELVCVDPAQIEKLWPHVSALIDKATERYGSKDERSELEASVKSGKALLWLAWSASRQIEMALVTDLVKEDDYLVCRLRSVAGMRVLRWIALIDKIEQYARNENCKSIRYIGRRGWSLMMSDDYRITHVIAEKNLRG